MSSISNTSASRVSTLDSSLSATRNEGRGSACKPKCRDVRENQLPLDKVDQQNNSTASKQLMEGLNKMFEMLSQLVTKLADMLKAKEAEAVKPPEVKAPEVKPPEVQPPASKELGMLWKPKSDKDGKLAISFPLDAKNRIASVEIVDPQSNKVLGKGKYFENRNKDREHYSFGKEGNSYPDGAIVRVKFKDGTTRDSVVQESSQIATNNFKA